MTEVLVTVVSPLHDTSSAGYWVYVAFHLLGLVGNLTVLITSLVSLFKSSRSARRRSEAWYGFFFGWTLYSFGALLLLFSGHSNDPAPPYATCAAQSVLTHSIPPYVAAATLSLISQLMLNVQAVISGSSVRFERCWKIFIIVFPYVVLVAVVVINIVMIIIQPLNKFNIVDYCSMDSVLLGAITAFGTILFVIPILVINVVLFIRIRRHSTTFRTSNNRYSRIMFIRATCFNGFGLIALVIGILFGVFFVKGSSSVNGVGGMNIILALFPIASIVVFGGDVFRELLFCGRRSREDTYASRTTTSNPSFLVIPHTTSDDYSSYTQRTHKQRQSGHAMDASRLNEPRIEVLRMVDIKAPADSNIGLASPEFLPYEKT